MSTLTPRISGVAHRRYHRLLALGDKPRCAYCTAPLRCPCDMVVSRFARWFTIDHVLAQANGGSDATTNLVLCCRPCNSSKGTTEVETWFGVHPANFGDPAYRDRLASAIERRLEQARREDGEALRALYPKASPEELAQILFDAS